MAGIKTTSARPVKLPVAPERYDKHDIDRTRRLIEQALAQYGLGLTGLATAVGSAPPADADKDFVPQSPIHGIIRRLGGTGTSALIQLSNPATSNKLVVVYRCDITYDSALTPGGNYLRITGDPLAQSGTPASSTLFHMDERDVTAITSTLTSAESAVSLFNQASWQLQLTADTTSIIRKGMWSVIQEGEMPAILLPGQTLEMVNARLATDSMNEMYVQFDELSLDDEPASSNTSGFISPRSGCIGVAATGLNITSVSGSLMVIQLYNPGPKLLRVMGLKVLAHNNNLTKVRRTDAPLVLGGTVFGMPVRRLDRRSTEPVTAILRISTNGGTTLFPQVFWQDKVGSAEGRLPWHTEILQPGSYPIYVKPGSAIEIATLAAVSSQNGCASTGLFLWDEVDE